MPATSSWVLLWHHQRLTLAGPPWHIISYPSDLLLFASHLNYGPPVLRVDSESSSGQTVLIHDHEFLSADLSRRLYLCLDRQGGANVVEHRAADKSRHKADSDVDFGVHGQVLVWGNRQSNHP